MRTPNCECVVCKKPLYRRPNELEKVRHVACMAHRAEAQKLSGITPAQRAGLSLGRRKGTNNRTGYLHRAESKAKTSEANKRFWRENPDKLAARGAKVTGDLNWQWKGGISKLSQSIRQMTEYRKWTDAVRARDRKCIRCGLDELLQAHHVEAFSELLSRHEVKSRNDAKNCAALWDISNGITLCEECHYKEHGRNYENQRNDVHKAA